MDSSGEGVNNMDSSRRELNKMNLSGEDNNMDSSRGGNNMDSSRGGVTTWTRPEGGGG